MQSDIGSPARGGVSATDDARISETEVGRADEVVRQVAGQPKCSLGARVTADDQRTRQVDALDSPTDSLVRLEKALVGRVVPDTRELQDRIAVMRALLGKRNSVGEHSADPGDVRLQPREVFAVTLDGAPSFLTSCPRSRPQPWRGRGARSDRGYLWRRSPRAHAGAGGVRR